MEAQSGPAGPERTEALERLHPESFGWALACARFDRAEAEDVLQASYLKVLEGRARFAGRSSFRTWLFAVIRRTAVERRRRAGLRARLVGGLARESAEGPPPPDEEAAASQEAGRLGAALLALPARQREVLHLVFYSGCSLDEAACVMGVAAGSARTHYARGKRALRGALAARLGRGR